MHDGILIRPMAPSDAEPVLSIYGQGIEDAATFESVVPSWEQWDADHHARCRLVAEQDGRVVAFAALSPVSKRVCYAGVAEFSLYVARESRGRGIGTRLLWALIEESERCGFWTLQGVTDEENAASLALQARCGFRVVGRRERIGQLRGQWRSTVLMERRSAAVGT